MTGTRQQRRAAARKPGRPADGLSARNNRVRLAPNRTALRRGLTGSVSVLALSVGLTLVAGPARAANDCGAPAGGVVFCNAGTQTDSFNNADGITYTTPNLTIIKNDGTATQFISSGGAGNYGDLSVDNQFPIVQTNAISPAAPAGIFVRSDDGDVRARTSAPITTNTNFVEGIEAISNGPANNGSVRVVTTAGGTITTNGVNAEGVFAYSANDTVTVDTAANITTNSGNDSHGIDAQSNGVGLLGQVRVRNTETIDVTGMGINAYSSGGTVTVRANNISSRHTGVQAESQGAQGFADVDVETIGNITTTQSNADGVNASSANGRVRVVVNNITTNGNGATGIDAQSTGAAGYGRVLVEANGTVSTTAGGGVTDAIYASSANDRVDVTANNISTVSNNSDGVDAQSGGAGANGQVNVAVTGTITTQGTNSDGVEADANGNGNVTVAVNNVSTSGGNANGVRAVANGGTVGVTVNGNVDGGTGGAAGVKVEAPGNTATVTIAPTGMVSSDNDRAIRNQDNTTNVVINNNGVMVGRVELADGTSTLNNTSNTWYSRTSSDFGGDTDTVNNTANGLIVGIGTHSWNNLEQVNNMGTLSLWESDAGAFNNAPGFETLTMSANFTGSANSLLRLDTQLGGSASPTDMLVIQGAVNGATLVDINNLGGAGAQTTGDGIKIIDASGGGGSIATAFALQEREFAGIYEYRLFEGTAAGADDDMWYLRSRVAPEAYEIPTILSGAVNAWHSTLGTMQDRFGEIGSMFNGAVNGQSSARGQTASRGVADVAEMTPHGARSADGTWVRILGGQEFLDQGTGSAFDQTTKGVQVGHHFGSRDVMGDGDAMMFGAFIGGLVAEVESDISPTEIDFTGGSGGVYVTYWNDGFYVDVVGKADRLEADFNAPVLGIQDDSTLVTAGGRVEMGYQLGLGDGFFMEPQVAAAYAHTWVSDDNIVAPPTTAVTLDDADSLRLRGGMRLGTHIPVDGGQVTPFVRGSVEHEFYGSNDANAAGVTLTNDLGGTTYRVGGGLTAGDTGEGLSVYLDGDYITGDDIEGYQAVAGLRIRW